MLTEDSENGLFGDILILALYRSVYSVYIRIIITRYTSIIVTTWKLK